VTVGYKDVYLISGEAVKVAKQGYLVTKTKYGDKLKTIDNKLLMEGNML
jgi:hypothetical protein